MLSKQISFLFFILLVLSISFPQVDGLGIGPPSFEFDLQIGGTNTTNVYITSDGLDGQLIVGKENLPFIIEPSLINMTKDDVNVPVEITFYGNETLEPGIYEGKITFLAMTGGFVAYGIKIRVKINLLNETRVEESENYANYTFEFELEWEEPGEDNSKNMMPYIIGAIGGMAGVGLIILVLYIQRKRNESEI